MKLAVVTPSWSGDFHRCQLLCRSLDQFLDPAIEHVLIVENRDLPLFRPLAKPGRQILLVEDIIPRWIRRIPLIRSAWLSLKTLPIRNWIMQQIVKLSVADSIDADGYIFMDSDMFLVRPVGPHTFLKEGQLALFTIPGHFQAAKAWHRASARLLGLPTTDFFGANYIGQMITWRRGNLQKLLQHVETTSGKPWPQSIAGEPRFSEYTLYGIFIDHVLKLNTGHFHDTRPLCQGIWNAPWGSDSQIQAFFQSLAPDQVAGMISSRIKIPPHRYESHWASIAGQAQSPKLTQETAIPSPIARSAFDGPKPP